MPTAVVGQQNTLTKTWTVVGTTGTLVIAGETAWDWGLTDLVRIQDTTTSTVYGLSPGATFSNTIPAGTGIPTYTWTLVNLPVGTASGDTILVYLNVSYQQLNVLLLQYQKA